MKSTKKAGTLRTNQRNSKERQIAYWPECRGEGEPNREEEGDLPVILSTGRETETGRRASTRTTARATPSPGSDHPGQFSDAAAVESATQTAGSSNHTTDTVNQLYIKHPGGFSHPGVREYSEP